jgi:hypothetical protein
MSRAVLVLGGSDAREKAIRWIRTAPINTRVEFKEPKRSLPQNDRFWAMLTDVAQQATHGGRKYTPDQWKVIFLHACGREAQFVPALDGGGFIPLGQSSSDLSKAEMSAAMEFIAAWGAHNSVVFHDQAAEAA